MTQVHDGQCGRCTHFGSHHADSPTLVQIRIDGEAPDDYVDRCGHPSLSALNVELSATSRCSGFAAA